MSESRVWQVVTTTDSEEGADRLATGLIEARLAACVEVDGPIKGSARRERRLHRLGYRGNQGEGEVNDPAG